MKKLSLFIILSLALVACNKESTPESSLESLISMRFNGGDRGDILKVVTGKLQQQIEGMSDENLSLFLETEGLKKRRLKVTLKNCEQSRCFITYILKYKDSRPTGSEFDVEVKKIAEVELVGETWLVSDISNLKTYIESKKEIKSEVQQ